VETRNFKGPRNLEATGLPLHRDNETIVKEPFQLDKANKDALLNEITVIDNAFTRPLDNHQALHSRNGQSALEGRRVRREQQSHLDRPG